MKKERKNCFIAWLVRVDSPGITEGFLLVAEGSRQGFPEPQHSFHCY